MSGGGFFRGTSADQDTRFSNKMKKLLKSQEFAPELDVTIDTSKVQMDVIKPWVATRVTELLGFEDEVLINFIYGMLEEKNVDGKHVQIQLPGFMEKNTGKFMKDLWSLLISAQSNVSGIPQQFLDQKAEETRLKKIESERIAAELQRKRDLDKLADEERQWEKIESERIAAELQRKRDLDKLADEELQRVKDPAAEAARIARGAKGSADNDRDAKLSDDRRAGRGNGDETLVSRPFASLSVSNVCGGESEGLCSVGGCSCGKRRGSALLQQSLAAMSGLGEAELERIQMKMASAAGQVSSGTVEKTRTEKSREKNKEKKEKKKKGSSSDPADSEVGDPSATPPSAPENQRPIFFQYAEGSMNLTMMVPEDFDASPNSLEMKQVCVQVSDIYCSRLGITSPVSETKFDFMLLAPDHMLVTLKDDEMGQGFEDQVKKYWRSLSDSLVKMDTLEQSLRKFQAQPKVKGADFEMLQSRVLEGESTALEQQNPTLEQQVHTSQQQIQKLEEQNQKLEQQNQISQQQIQISQQQIQISQQQIQTLQQQMQTHQSHIDQLLSNAELQYATRRRILIQDARKKLLRKLGLTKKKKGTWEEFIKNLSPEEKVRIGVPDDVLELMATGMYTLNVAVHTSDNDKEMAHAVNNIKNKTLKTRFQALYTFSYDANPEDVEFITVVAKS